jgi:hypothetical protein
MPGGIWRVPSSRARLAFASEFERGRDRESTNRRSVYTFPHVIDRKEDGGQWLSIAKPATSIKKSNGP